MAECVLPGDARIESVIVPRRETPTQAAEKRSSEQAL